MKSITKIVVIATIFSFFTPSVNAQSLTERNICKQSGEYAVFANHHYISPTTPRQGTITDKANIQGAHEHIFFCNNGKIVDNVGFKLPSNRFTYSSSEITSGKANRGGRVDDFIPIDNIRYDSGVIRSVLSGSVVLPESCKLDDSLSTEQQGFDDGVYTPLVNNCQGWTARAREFYWKRIFVGTWKAQISDNQYQIQVTWNTNSNRYEGVLVKLGDASQYVGFSVGELVWIGNLTDPSNNVKMTVKQTYRSGKDGHSTGSTSSNGVVDLQRSNFNILIMSPPNRLGEAGETVFKRTSD
ncbi:MAG TPA: hypothetical protein DCQ51_22130 [Planktothrix sp. UBA8407]|nr:hypothetical protein [Planktothrix sp. UBA8407]